MNGTINQNALNHFGIVNQEMVMLKVLNQLTLVITNKLLDAEINKHTLSDAIAKVYIQLDQLDQLEMLYKIEPLVGKKIEENQNKISNLIQINKIISSCVQSSQTTK